MTSRPLVLLLGASLAAVVALAACSGSNGTVGADDSGPGDGGPGAPSGDAASEGSDGSVNADGSVDAADGSRSCDDLSQAYEDELSRSQSCNTVSLVNECTAPRERVLGCACITYVNANGVAALDKIAAAWASQGCGPAACSRILCRVATGGSCTGGSGGGGKGTCVDTF